MKFFANKVKDKLAGALMAAANKVLKPVKGISSGLFKSKLKSVKISVKPEAFLGGGVKPPKVITSPQAVSFLTRNESLVRSVFLAEKRKLISATKNHPLSQELSDWTSPSQYIDAGTLFAFMGFNSNRKPVDELVEFLEEKVQFGGFAGSEYDQVGSKVNFRYLIQSPNRKEFVSSGLFGFDEWETSNPWPFAVEDFIPGYSHFLPLYLLGRSQGGLQNAKKVRSSSFTTTPYISDLLADFQKNVAKKSGALIVLT